MKEEADRLRESDSQPMRPPKKFDHASLIESSNTKQHLEEEK
jgi:hypothetical protein